MSVEKWRHDRKCLRQISSNDLADAFITAMTYNMFFVCPGLVNEKQIISYEQATESVVSDAVFEYQQCQTECKHDLFADVDDFQDTAPVADEYFSSSTFAARGNIAQSLLLPSDADQMLGVRMSMSRSH